MAQIIVRKLSIEVKRKLQHRARRNGRSMEEEVREILGNAVRDNSRRKGGLGTEIAARFKGIGLDRDIPELRGYEVKPIKFD